MKRRKLSSKQANRTFKKGARTHGKNITRTALRGGIRL